MLTLAQHVNCDVDGNISWDQGAHARKGKESEATSIKRNGTSDNHTVASTDDITIVPVKDEEKPPQDSGNLRMLLCPLFFPFLEPRSAAGPFVPRFFFLARFSFVGHSFTPCSYSCHALAVYGVQLSCPPSFPATRQHKFSTSLNLSVPASVFRSATHTDDANISFVDDGVLLMLQRPIAATRVHVVGLVRKIGDLDVKDLGIAPLVTEHTYKFVHQFSQATCSPRMVAGRVRISKATT